MVVGSSEARLRLNRFARLLPQLLSQKQLPLLRADLRYTNGFALGWPSPGARPAPEAGRAPPPQRVAATRAPSQPRIPHPGSTA